MLRVQCDKDGSFACPTPHTLSPAEGVMPLNEELCHVDKNRGSQGAYGVPRKAWLGTVTERGMSEGGGGESRDS